MKCRAAALLCLLVLLLALAFSAARSGEVPAQGLDLVLESAVESAVECQACVRPPASGPVLAAGGGAQSRSRDGSPHCACRPGRSQGVAEDPWLAASEAEVTTPAPEAPRLWRVLRALPVSGGGVHLSWSHVDPTVASDLPLVTYELSRWKPRREAGCSSLRGLDAPSKTPSGVKSWWTLLSEAIVAAVGASEWPPETTLLAWDPKGLLVVRHHERALAAVERVLDRVDRAHGSILPVRLRLVARSQEEALTLALDVPWHERVRACQGTSWTYLQDFDVEISMECFVSDPIWGGLETGLGFSVMRTLPEGEQPGGLDIEVSWCADAPVFEEFQCTLCEGVAVQIELPRLSVHTWRGWLPVRPGTRTLIPLDESVQVELEIGRPDHADEPPARTWRRMDPSRGDVSQEHASPARSRRELAVTLSGSLSGTLGHGRTVLGGADWTRGRESGGPPAGRHETATLCLRTCSPTWAAAGYDAEARHAGWDRSCRGPWMGSGRIDIELTPCGAVSTARQLDFRLSMGEWTGQTRHVQVKYDAPPVDAKLDRSMELPCAYTLVTCRRMSLSQAGAGSLSFLGDIGRGPELFTLDVQVCAIH